MIKSKKYGFLSLIVLSLLAGLIWRIEVEYHGWRGLIWLQYLHKSIPIDLLFFLLWINFAFNFDSIKQRLLLNTHLLGLMILGAIAITSCLQFSLISGPTSFFKMMQPKWLMHLQQINVVLFIPLFPLFAFLNLRLHRLAIPIKIMLLGQLIWILAFPIAIRLLEMVAHRGSHDVIHAVKSGFVFPFLFFALGMPLIYVFQKKKSLERRHDPLDQLEDN